MATPEHTVEFGILGPLRLAAGGVALDVGGGKRSGLVARLLVDANRAVPAHRLVEDLWGADEDTGSAPATVQTYVSRLRKVLGPGRVLTRSRGYEIVVRPGELDADRLEALLAEARRPDLPPDEAVELLAEAEKLWRGPALADFAAAAWARPAAERLERLRVAAAGDRAEALLRAGRAQEAAGDLEALVERHRLDERLWHQLVLAHYRCGRQADALRAYQRARAALMELGVEPGPALRALERAVLAQDPSLDAEPAAPERRDPPAPAPAPAGPARLDSDLSWVPPALAGLVGRARAMEALERTVAAAAEGHGRLALVGAEPGAGKTRLLAELADRADAEGCLVLYGRCDEDTAVPYLPFVAALAPALRAADLDLGALAADLAVLFPDLGAPAGGWPEPPASVLDQDSRRHRLFEAIDRALAELARRQTVVLLLDDLQWADRAVLLLLRHVARSLAARRIAVVGAFRSDAGDALRATLLDLRRHLPAIDVPVDRLTGEEIADLLAQWIGDDLRERRRLLAERLRRETAGNALFVTEVVRDLLHQEGGGGEATLADPEAAELPLPTTVTDVVAFRVLQLRSETQRFLSAAAVMGTVFDVAVAAEVAGLDEDAAMDAIDEAMERGLVVDSAEPVGRMAFSHALARRALDARLASPRRTRLHLAVARALQRRDPEPADVEGLARHFAVGAALSPEAVREATRYARLAGDRAVAQLAYETGIAHYRRALDLLSPEPEGPDAGDRSAVLLALGEALNQGGDTEEAKDRLLEAAATATARGDTTSLVRAALAFGGVLPAGVDLADRRATELLGRAIQALPPGDSADRALLLGRLAQAEYWVRPRAARAGRCAEAVAIARRVGDARALARVLINRYWALEGPDEVEARLRSSAEVEAIADRLDDPELALQGGKCRLHVLLGLDSWPEARRLAEQLRRLADEVRQPEYQRLALSFDAVVAGNAGRFRQAEQLARRARDLLRLRGQKAHASVVHTLQLVPWRWLEGRLAEQIERLERIVQKEPQRPTWRALLAWAHAETGHPESAARHLWRLDLRRYLARDHAFDFWLVTVPAALAAARLGDRDTAGRLYDALVPYAGHNAFVGQVAFLGCVDHHLGELALALGHDEAVKHLTSALDRHRAMDATAYAERTARVLAGTGAA